jgi:glycosyltransferase involved in cell wall biosynthesis
MVLVDETHWPKIHVVPCGVDVRRFAPHTRPRAGSSASLNVLAVGRLVAVKGHAVLLDALRELRDRDGPPVTLDIVGDGPRRAALEERTRSLGLGRLVTFHGRVGHDEITRHYAAADAFCLPSFAEGVPVVLMEAMAMEIPVVASRVMGIPELVEDSRSGLLVRPGRSRAIADALARLAASEQLRHQLGRAGRARIHARFSLERSVRALQEIYEAEGVARLGPGC